MGQKFAAYDENRTITGYYDDALSPPPKGFQVVAITAAQHKAMLTGEASGKRTAIDLNGVPVLLDPLPLTEAQLDAAKRMERDAALRFSDWYAARHQDELMIGKGTTLTADQLDSLLNYRKALRDLPLNDRWPEVELPSRPDFLAAQDSTSPSP
ncbi:phage tail assembly chaperone [Paraburkholderia fungorum]|uniref:Phage tail protein n=1 Tax=Paraburkholderia fungorum TaxID=134537 RepID=A0A420FTA1_9BURK|nr:phage tail assembly chaperone [Paraburkholderia fungorum]RKF36155.1 hypothetical protein BCY88_36790 [Paraburkholderia fungorum]